MQASWWRHGTVLAGGLALTAQAMAQAPVAPVGPPRAIRALPVTDASRPYMSAADARVPIDLSGLGYVEEELGFDGVANVYDWAADGSVSVLSADAPYASRMLIRRPADPAKFSGVVWVEFLNPVAGTDMSSGAWGYANYSIIDRGDAWIGVSAAGRSLRTLKAFDAGRYAFVAMANPAPLAGGCAEAGEDYSPATEDGLRWDMLGQVGAALKGRRADRPLAMLDVRRAYVFGQSNGDLPTYIAAFANRAVLADGRPVWDGYLLKDSGIAIAAHQCGTRPSADDPRRVLRDINAPVVQMVVEDGILMNLGSRREDSDAPGDRYRRYEIPGAAHNDPYVQSWLPRPEVMEKVGIAPLWPLDRACFPRREPNDFPIHYYVAGAMRLLDEWAGRGAAPPRAGRIHVDNAGRPDASIPRDRFGNGTGGVRNAFVEVPDAAYNQPGPCAPRGDRKVAFDWSTLENVHGSHAAFAAKRAEAVDRDVAARWLPAVYAARIKAGRIGMPTADTEEAADRYLRPLREGGPPAR